jgi:hypothetical protein
MGLPATNQHFAFWQGNALQHPEIEFSGTGQRAMSKLYRQLN